MKIDIKDLRVGSWVLDRGGKRLRIDRFYGNKIECDVKGMPDKDPDTGIKLYYHPYTEEIDYLQPVALTEEILVKAGFKNITKEWFPDKCYLIEVDGVRYHYWMNEKTLYRAEESYLAKVETLHHLQAILWDLAKIEITL